MMTLIVFVVVVVVAWLLNGYINYEAYYHQALIANYIERKGLPYPTSDDFEESERELRESRRSDVMLHVFLDRFPFNRIPMKYLPRW